MTAPGAEFRPWKVFDPDDPDSFVGSLRGRRWNQFVTRFPELSSMSVLDLGGTPASWAVAPVKPGRLVILNTSPSGFDSSVQATVIKGDACDPPTEVKQDRFDLVFSNSVIEHVGGHESRKRFAESARESAPHHWIQTPYRYFPVEPHFLFPGLQFLPLKARTLIARHWGPVRRDLGRMKMSDAIDNLQWIELLSITDMQVYFPDSEIVHEHLGGLVKSLIAVR